MEPIWQEYRERDVSFLGIDVYDGAPDQVELLFRTSGRTSFPLLLRGSSTARAFKSNIEYALVIDHRGIVQYHEYGVSGREPKIREVLSAALKAAQEETAETPRIKGAIDGSWGEIKVEAITD